MRWRTKARALTGFATVVGVIGLVTVSGQERNAQSASSEVDFSGVYAVGVFTGVPTATEEPDVYPFTAEGERAHRAYDPLVSDPRQVDDCAAEPMPEILWSANPMQIIQEAGRIVMRYEDADTTRSIAMDGAPPPPDQPYTGLGYSVGHWEGEELVIETTHMASGVIFSNRGYPISREARITERYRRESATNALRLEIVVNDPVNYTQSFAITRGWIWSPDEQIRPWECFSLGPRDSESPDIDELARMLEEL